MKLLEYKQLFLNEAQEILNSLNNVLVNLEKDPADLALLHELFRQSHTLKSMAQSMGYEDIAKLTHSMEAALSLLRCGRLRAEKDTVDLLFKCVDALIDLVEEVTEGKTKKVHPIRKSEFSNAAKMAALVERLEEIASAVSREEGKPVKEKKAEEISPALSFSEVQAVRVPLAQLDSLMDLAGELVINRIRLAQIAQTIENDALEKSLVQMSRLTSKLQDQMMKVRLVPLEYIFTPYPRLVRDMAVEQKKEVDLLIEGGHIGLDRSIQDEINEPLLHLIKNAVTHGIERPEERERLKKLRRGKIKLVARRERNFVVIELSDDGCGIDIEEIKKVALKTGIITMEELSALTPKEVIMFITSPGYSRTKKVTEAAGRGVGLNASRIKVESLGGTLDIKTRLHEGTTFFIKLPLTLAVVQALLVGIADETYCIPLSCIAETLKVSPGEIKTVESQEMISYRDTVLPLIRLGEKFGFPRSSGEYQDSEIECGILSVPVVVVEAGSKKAGLVVDSLSGQQEVVIKPLTGISKEIKGASGATILGTGKAALIVDVGSLL